MSDLIDRQAALDAIKKLEKPAPTARHLSAIFDCEDIIKALPSAQRWIPCSRELPKEEERSYWVCMEDGYQKQCRWKRYEKKTDIFTNGTLL